jgi:hypothetical protein
VQIGTLGQFNVGTNTGQQSHWARRDHRLFGLVDHDDYGDAHGWGWHVWNGDGSYGADDDARTSLHFRHSAGVDLRQAAFELNA